MEALCDIAIAVLFYFLLKPVGPALALTTAFLGLFSAALYAVCEIFYFGLPLLLLHRSEYLASFTPQQIDSLILLSLKLFNSGAGLFLIVYGIGWIIRGWLMIQSGYFPRLLGVLMIIGGVGFALKTLIQILVPQYENGLLLLAMLPGGVLLGLWLLVRGVDLPEWEPRTAR